MSNIIFIPGIKGTELFLDTNKKWFPKNKDDLNDLHIKNDTLIVGDPINSVTAFTKVTVNIYKGIYDNFSIEAGEIDFFGYDWRKDIQIHVPDLVNRIRALSKKGKVTVVAHSMGGMLAKLAILKMDELGLIDNIDSLITIGTPWGGSPDAFKALAYGEPGFYAELKPFFGLLYSYGDTRKLARQCPSVYQLLPSESYYKDETGKFIKHRESKEELQYMDVIQTVQTMFYEEYKENNPEYSKVPDVWLQYMKPVQEAMLKPLPSELKHHCIIGHKFPTLCRLPDGTSEKYNKFKFKSSFTNGDAVVPLLSGIPQNAAELYYVKGEHGGLCSDEVVITLLKGILNNQIEKTLPQGVSRNCDMKLKWALKTRFLCPIETTIMDSEGRYIAGSYDTDISEESPILNETEVKYISVGDSQYIFFEELDEDLKIQINSYETGVADISAEYLDENDRIIELELDPLPVDRGLSAIVTIPVLERIESANIEQRGSIISDKRIRTTARVIEKQLPDRINLKVSISAFEESKKAHRRDVFSGKVLLTIASTNDELLDRVFFSINNETPQEYSGPTILNLPSGSFELQAFGKDKFERPIKTQSSKFSIDNAQPITEFCMVVTPDGMIIDFEPHTEGSKVKETFYKIVIGSEVVAEGAWEGEALTLPWGILNIDSNAKMTIDYNSVSEFNVTEDVKSLDLTLGNIPQLMWDDNAGYVTPEMVLNNLLKHTSIDLNSFEIYANVKNTENIKLNKNNQKLTLNEGIKDNAKSIRFISNLASFEVMFLEKYALYFIDFPTEKLKIGNSYTFSFELLPDRGVDPIINTNPHAKIKSPKSSKIPDKHLELKLIDGRFHSSFYVDESFVQFKNKLVISDVKNTHPPLREITLITKEE